MKPLRVAAWIAVVGAVAVLVWWLLRADPGDGTPDAIGKADAREEGAASLRGSPPPAAAESEVEPAVTSRDAAESAGTGAHQPYDLEVLDYRSAGVPGVQVFHEVDLLDVPSAAGRKWKTLDSGTTDERGHVRLGLDRNRRRQPDEGLNHRLRVVPPVDREDLAPTWRLWSPEQGATFHLTQTHVIEGRVLDAAGEPVWAAIVWVGPLPDPHIKVVNPAWRKTTTDPDGRFRIAGIPTTRDWRIDVWAVGPGRKEPASSAEVQGAQSVALDTKTVEIRLP